MLELWEQVQYIGFDIVPDIQERFLLFCEAYERFDFSRRTSFISYYYKWLRTNKSTNASQVTENVRMIKRLQRQSISPTKVSKLTRFLMKWRF